MQRARLVAAFLAAFVIACGSTDRIAREDSGASIIALDSIELIEADSAYIGRPVGLAVSPSGDYFVIDGFRPRVLRYNREGLLQAQFGRSGEGPGEFMAPSGLAFISDTVLAVIDFRGNFISLFDRRSGKYYRRRAFEGSYRSISVGRDSLWLGLWNTQLRTAVALWSVADDSISHLIPIPEVYQPQSLTQMLLDNTVVVPYGDSLVVGFAGERRLSISNRAGKRIATFEIPVASRRGLPVDVEDRMRKSSSIEEAVLQSSYLLTLGRLSSGALVVVHADMELKSKIYLMDVFVSIVSPDFKQACVDAKLPLGREAQPWISMFGDTLVALEQLVTESDRPVSIVRRFLLDQSSCAWKSTALESAIP